MQTYTLKCELIAPVSMKEAFALFENPYNLAKITPPWLGFKILSPEVEMRKDLEIDYLFHWLGIPLRWKTRITTYEPPFDFVDEALRSPYLFWRNHHCFRPMEEGTVVSDRVDYAMPYGPVGALAHQWIVARQLREIFDFRQKAIMRLLGGRATELQEPVITAPR